MGEKGFVEEKGGGIVILLGGSREEVVIASRGLADVGDGTEGSNEVVANEDVKMDTGSAGGRGN